MKAYQANLLNILTLILMSLWAYFTYEPTLEKPEPSITTLIPTFFAIILFLCNKGLKKEKKLASHLVVLFTFLAVLGLLKPFTSALETDNLLVLFRVGVMIFTGLVALVIFIQSFVQARRNRQ